MKKRYSPKRAMKEILAQAILEDPVITHAMVEVILDFLRYSIDLNREYAKRMEENYKRALEEMGK